MNKNHFANFTWFSVKIRNRETWATFFYSYFFIFTDFRLEKVTEVSVNVAEISVDFSTLISREMQLEFHWLVAEFLFFTNFTMEKEVTEI